MCLLAASNNTLKGSDWLGTRSESSHSVNFGSLAHLIEFSCRALASLSAPTHTTLRSQPSLPFYIRPNILILLLCWSSISHFSTPPVSLAIPITLQSTLDTPGVRRRHDRLFEYCVPLIPPCGHCHEPDIEIESLTQQQLRGLHMWWIAAQSLHAIRLAVHCQQS